MKKDRVNEENTIIKNPRKLDGYNETIKLYELNRNHKFGKLDEIKLKEIDIINEKIKKEFFDKKNKNELNKLERDSLNDLRPQLYDPNKQFTNMGNMSNTLFQNHENNQKISDININNNNNNNDNIDKPTPDNQEINNDINNNLNNNIYNNINNSGNQNNNINNINKELLNNQNESEKEKEININNKENIDVIPEGPIPSGSNSQYEDFEVADTDNKKN